MTHYLVCTTPRTGSALLCSLLGETGVAGMRPIPIVGRECLLELMWGPLAELEWEQLELTDHLDRTFRKTSTPNGVAGFKVMWSQGRHVGRTIERSTHYRCGAADLPRFLPEGTKFVWLVRRDRLRQAVSWTRAIQTQCWSRPAQRRFHGVELFDYVRVRAVLAAIERQNHRWEQMFERNGIQPLRIVCEEFLGDPERTLREVLEWLGVRVEAQIDVDRRRFGPGSDDLIEEWMRRFRQIESSAPLPRAWRTAWAYPRWAAAATLGRMRARPRLRARRSQLNARR